MSEYLQVAREAAEQAGVYLVEHYRDEHQVTYKDAHNVVTEADTASEEIILRTLRQAFPDHVFYTEEHPVELAGSRAEFIWIVDPLDGSSNYLHGLTYFGVSIALLHHKVPLLGVVYHPMQHELFIAEKGKGASLNDHPIRMSESAQMEKALVALNRGASKQEKVRYGEILRLLTNHVRSLRVPGATALDICNVAANRFDAYIGNGIEFYDAVAANLVAVEAGTCVTNFHHAPWELQVSDLLVAHPTLHRPLATILQQM